MKKTLLSLLFASSLFSSNCADRYFTYEGAEDSTVTLKQLLNKLIVDECHMNIVYKDSQAKARVDEMVGKITALDYSFNEFLDILLSDRNFFYQVKKDKLEISYIKTETFKVDYISTSRTGTSTITASSQQNSDSNTITASDVFDFWTSFSTNIASIVNTSEDTFTANTPIIDKNAGLITVTATKQQLERVLKYIEDVNNRLHKQIIIDVKVYSVNLADEKRVGINWEALNFSLADSLTSSDGTTSYSSLTTRLSAGNLGGSGSIFSNTNFNVRGFLNFLSTHGNVNSISNPKIATLHNQKAIISVGDTINYRYPTEVTIDDNGNAVTEYATESKFVGILLDITPEVSETNEILLKINPIVSYFRDVTQLNDDSRLLPPDTTENKLSTIVKINDGQTLVLGGLITNKNTFKNNGVPVLKELPILKYAFSYKENISERTELVFVITPHVVDPNKKRTIKDLGFKSTDEL